MTWTAADIPDLTGRVAIVTGGNGGLGRAAATALAGKGAHVVLAARDQTKARTARAGILADHPDASVEIVEIDLGSLSSVERAATTISETHDRVDVLMNNAGLMAMPRRTTEDGFDVQWGVNVIGHYALTARLLPLIVSTPGSRVVWLSSVAQHQARSLADDPQMRDDHDPWGVYAQTKLADRLLAQGLQQRFAAAGVGASSFVAHPGLTDSDLQQRTERESDGDAMARFWARLTPRVGMSTDRGVLSQLRAATEPGADPDRQYAPLLAVTGPPVAKPMVRPGTGGDIERLLAMAERDTGLVLDVVAARDAA